ncbi:histidine kinase, partial [Streptomyces sp. NPDC127110]|uniref:histidine kinase n=1 Tax=Streptomyces sp. NPDC127110 TaxID=3345362 RepID=UPI00363B0B0A
MLQRPRRGDPFWIWALHGWEVLSWALIALVTLITLVGDAPPRTSYGMPALVAVLALGYALVRFRPGNPVLRPYGYLWLLVAVLGGLSYVGDGLGVFYTVTLAQFVVFADTLGAAVLSTGLGAVAITVGGTLREGWSAEVLTTNAISSLAVFAVGVLISAVTPRALALRDERARLRAELKTAQQELVEAYQRQGAAEERERLAREIHDTLAQGFASIVVLAEAGATGYLLKDATRGQLVEAIHAAARG